MKTRDLHAEQRKRDIAAKNTSKFAREEQWIKAEA
jgi:hypothetical protein